MKSSTDTGENGGRWLVSKMGEEFVILSSIKLTKSLTKYYPFGFKRLTNLTPEIFSDHKRARVSDAADRGQAPLYILLEGEGEEEATYSTAQHTGGRTSIIPNLSSSPTSIYLSILGR